ncbi:hypothetical protein [Sulfolobus acidocaldarius]|nr:hypothetical protein [Sulfolobus acidocaldarius]
MQLLKRSNLMETVLFLLLLLFLILSLLSPIFLIPAIGLSALNTMYDKYFLPIPLSLILLLLLGIHEYYTYAVITLTLFLVAMVVLNRLKYHPF